MKRRVVNLLLCSVAASLAVLGSSVDSAVAKTLHAAIGSPFNGADKDWVVGNPGVTRTTAINSSWMVPLIFDTPGAKTIVVKGRVVTGSGNTIDCGAFVYDNAGTLVSFTGLTSLPATNTLTSISLPLSTVPLGGTGYVQCNFKGPSPTINPTNMLLGVDYVS